MNENRRKKKWDLKRPTAQERYSKTIYNMLYILAWFCPCSFISLVVPILFLDLLDIRNTTPELSTFPRHVAWRDSVGRWCTGIFTVFLPSCYAVLKSSKKSETAVYGCNPALLCFYQSRVDVLQS